MPARDFEGPIVPFEYDESTDQTVEHLVVKPSSAGKVKLNAASTTYPIGTLLNKAKAGGDASVRLFNSGGVQKVVVNGAVSYGDYLTGATGGKAETANAAADVIFGRALEAATADDDVIAFEPMSAVLGDAVGLT